MRLSPSGHHGAQPPHLFVALRSQDIGPCAVQTPPPLVGPQVFHGHSGLRQVKGLPDPGQDDCKVVRFAPSASEAAGIRGWNCGFPLSRERRVGADPTVWKDFAIVLRPGGSWLRTRRAASQSALTLLLIWEQVSGNSGPDGMSSPVSSAPSRRTVCPETGRVTHVPLGPGSVRSALRRQRTLSDPK